MRDSQGKCWVLPLAHNNPMELQDGGKGLEKDLGVLCQPWDGSRSGAGPDPVLALLRPHLRSWGLLWASHGEKDFKGGLEHVQGRERSWEGNGAPGEAEGAGKEPFLCSCAPVPVPAH